VGCDVGVACLIKEGPPLDGRDIFTGHYSPTSSITPIISDATKTTKAQKNHT
jgi:hypothetical protein